MQDMTEELETLLLCASICTEDRDCVERALDEGYETLDPMDKSLIRRLLNQQAAHPAGALMRYRERRAQRRLPPAIISSSMAATSAPARH